MNYLLDTHTWVWWNMRPQNLSRRVRNLIEQEDGYEELLLSVISPWEFCKLLEKGKLGIAVNPEDWVNSALEMPKLRMVQLTPRIACRSAALPQPFHDDPADQIIVATAREEHAVILTKDRRLLNYKHVQSVW